MPSSDHKREIQYTNDFPWQQKEDFASEELALKERSKNEQKEVILADDLGDALYGRSLKWYKEAALWPMFILLIVELGARVMQTKYFPLWNEEIFSYIIYLSRVAIFCYLGISVVKQYKGTKQQAIAAAVLGGLITGFLLAVFQLFWYFELWTFFNIIGQPLLMAAMGLVTVWLATSIFFNRLIK